MNATDTSKVIEYGPATPERPVRSEVKVLVAALALTWLFFISAGVYLYYSIRGETLPAAANAATTEAQIRNLMQQVTQLKQVLAAQNTNAGTEAVQGVEDKMGVIESRLSTLETAETVRKKDVHSTAFVALLALQERIRMGEPFATELDTLSSMLVNDGGAEPSLTALSPYAEKGTLTLETIRNNFAPMVKDVLLAGKKSDGTVRARIEQQLAKVITFRKIDGTGSDVENIIARAELALKQADMAEAVDALEQLQGKEREAAEAWLVDARALVESDEAVGALSQRLKGQILSGNLPADKTSADVPGTEETSPEEKTAPPPTGSSI